MDRRRRNVARERVGQPGERAGSLGLQAAGEGGVAPNWEATISSFRSQISNQPSRRCLHPRTFGEGESSAITASIVGEVDPTFAPRSHRPAAVAAGGGCVCEGSFAVCLQSGRREAAFIAALRRALGSPLAGCRTLRGLEWLRERSDALHLVLSRLGDQCVQS